MSNIQPVKISGRLRNKDLHRLVRMTRGGTVGPTVVYYAGATAPVISASMALMTRSAFHMVGMTDYWSLLLSAIIAAFTGIAWYTIFIRWSYRTGHGRGTETVLETEIEAGPTALVVRRGNIETRIGWDAVSEVKEMRSFVSVLIEGADALIVPDKWFGKDKAARKAFRRVLHGRGKVAHAEA